MEWNKSDVQEGNWQYCFQNNSNFCEAKTFLVSPNINIITQGQENIHHLVEVPEDNLRSFQTKVNFMILVNIKNRRNILKTLL